MLDDTGNFAYDSSDMRRYVLSTRAHNTGLVDGMGQNRRKTYNWQTEDIKKLSNLCVEQREGVTVAYGSYSEGYGSELLPAVHERRVYFFREGIGGSKPFFALLDDFCCEDGLVHKYEASFQLGAQPITAEGRSVTVDFGEGISLGIVGTGALELTTASVSPFMGWRPNRKAGNNPHYPAPVLSYSQMGERARILTVLYPTDGEMPRIDAIANDQGFLIAIDGTEHKEVV